MHDNYIVGYNVNLKEKEVVICTCDSVEKEWKKVYFKEVLTHSFNCILDYNIILDICENEINNFFHDNYEEVVKLRGYGWPISYQTEKELIDFLITNRYKYIKITSSYGMFGWVLAKDYQII